MKYQAVLFDLDGTVVDSLEDLADAVNYTLSIFNRPQLSLEGVRPLIGKGARNLVTRALQSGDPDEIEQGLTCFLEYNSAHIADKSRLYPGIAELLRELSGNGVALAAVSNKNEALSRQILEAFGALSFFSLVCGGDTYHERKPSPLPLLKSAERLGVPIETVVMVGDSINDIQAGLRAGMATIGCAWGYGAPEELRDATFLVDNCRDISHIVLCES